MKKPTQEEIDGFFRDARGDIAESKQDIKDGYYKKEDIPMQSVYTSLAGYYADLARAHFLNSDPLPSVREAFSTAAQYIIKSFLMAYDETDPEYVGDKWPPKNPNYTGEKGSIVTVQWLSGGYGQVSWANVSETRTIEGFNWAMMAANLDLARTLAHWYQDRKDGTKMEAVVNRYTYAWKYGLLGEADKGRDLLKLTIDKYIAKPPKANSADMNYFTLSLTLFGILTNDEARFNQGLEQVLAFYEKAMIPSQEVFDSEVYMCDHAVALSNLAITYGLKVTLENDLLPKELLIKAESE